MTTLVFPVDGLLSPLREYVVSSSGSTRPSQGLSLGGVGAVLSALAVVLGVQGRANADDCYGIPYPGCAWICEGSTCLKDDGQTYGKLEQYWCHEISPHRCVYYTDRCADC